MKATDIIAELDALKLKIMIDGVEEQPTDLEKYESWIDKLIGRKTFRDRWKDHAVFHPEEYATCKAVANLVQDLFHKKHGHNLWFHREAPRIRETIQEIVFMTRFVEQEIKD